MPSPPITIKPLERPFDVTFPDPRKGIPPIPGSKSLTNRALLLAALADGTSTLTGVLFSDDTKVMMKALTGLGFKLDIDEPNTTVTVHGQAGTIPNPTADLHLGNAGTAMRFLTAACCLGKPGTPGSVYTLDGIPRMRERPIGELIEPLRKLGAKIEYLGNEGYPPLRITACGLAGNQLTLKPTLSSQFISALLQISPCLDNGLTISFDGPVTSEPYVRMTLRLMQQFGANADANADMTIASGKTGGYKPFDYVIEPDASNASYFLAAAAITPDAECRIGGLGPWPLQGDAAFPSVLSEMDVFTGDESDTAIVAGSQKLRCCDTSLNDMPDMAQTLAVVALFAEGKTVIRNVGNLRVKETDRMEALRIELSKLGAEVTIKGDDIHITPPNGGILLNAKNGKPISDTNPVYIDTYDDHRMAMAFSIAGLKQAGIRINDPGCVNKTFPRFFEYLEYLRG